MRPIRFFLVHLFACAQALAQAGPPSPGRESPRTLSVSVSLGLNAAEPEAYENMADNGMQWTLSARAAAQVGFPVRIARVFPSLEGYVVGEPRAWEAGGNMGLNWSRNGRETYGVFGGALEKGLFDPTSDSPPKLDRWHGFQAGLTGRWGSRSIQRLGLTGLAAVQFKRSYGSNASDTGLQAYVGLDMGVF